LVTAPRATGHLVAVELDDLAAVVGLAERQLLARERVLQVLDAVLGVGIERLRDRRVEVAGADQSERLRAGVDADVVDVPGLADLASRPPA
jgi:hypothetical protein